MACNGNNHPPDCQCNFRGGHPNSESPRWQNWSSVSARSFSRKPNATCRKCGKRIWYIPGPKGGGFYAEECQPPWRRHPCMDPSLQYSPFNAKGRPKLRNRLSEFEHRGWLPFIVRKIEQLPRGTLIKGVALDSKTFHYLGSVETIQIDNHRPTYIREAKNKTGLIEMNYFSIGETEPQSALLIVDCRNEIELITKTT